MELGGRLHHDGRFPEGQYPIRSLGSMVYVDDFIESRKNRIAAAAAAAMRALPRHAVRTNTALTQICWT
jgi:hypothetical protein